MELLKFQRRKDIDVLKMTRKEENTSVIYVKNRICLLLRCQVTERTNIFRMKRRKEEEDQENM